MKLKKILSLVLVFVLAVSVLCFPVTGNAKDNSTKKIDTQLQNLLDKMEDNDRTIVSLWFTDINYDIVNERAIKKVKDNLSKDVLEIVKAENNYTELLELSVKEAKKSIVNQKHDSKEIQKYIQAKRKISSEMQEKRNKDLFIKSFGSYSNPKIIYESKYAPNVDVILSKKEIYRIVDFDYVDAIFISSSNLKILDDNTEENQNKVSQKNVTKNSNIDTSYFSVTGIDQMKSVYGLLGDGVNIGVYDSEFTPSLYIDYFEHSNISEHVTPDCCEYYNIAHGNVISSIISGYKSEGGQLLYSGAAPYADLYWTSGYNYKHSMEYLIDNNVNVINMSRKIGITEEEQLQYPDYVDPDGIINEYNQYGDVSKWLDHVVYQHGVHLVCSAGNDKFDSNNNPIQLGVSPGKMAHNAIVVGNCNNNGELVYNSSYSSSDVLPYKPDLVAPGYNISTIAMVPAYAGVWFPNPTPLTGTSFSAAMVTGVVAQLCELSAILRNSPSLMKAIVLCGTKRTNYMISNSIQSVLNNYSIAFDHAYGCGMLNAVLSRGAYTGNQYSTGVLTSTSSNVNFTKSISAKKIGRQIRIVLTWDKVNRIDGLLHEQGSLQSVNCDKLAFQVTDPDNNVYSTYYQYDNKAMISFPANHKIGNYVFNIVRNYNSGESINYAIAYSVQNE